MLKKLPIKNKKKSHSAKKISKVTQNQEQASELPSQVNQASQAILKSQTKLVSHPKTGKIMLKKINNTNKKKCCFAKKS